MRARRAEQHTLRHNDSRPAAQLQQGQKPRDEQQLGLLRLYRRQLWIQNVLVNRARKRRVRQQHIERLKPLWRQLLQGVEVGNVRVAKAVHDHVHRGDAHHRGIEIESGQAAGEVLLALQFGGVLEVVAQVFAGGGEEACGAAGRVDKPVGDLRLSQRHDEFDDVAWCSELSVRAGGGQFGQHVFVQVAGHVLIGELQLRDHRRDRRQCCRVRDQERCVFHVGDKPAVTCGAELFDVVEPFAERGEACFRRIDGQQLGKAQVVVGGVVKYLGVIRLRTQCVGEELGLCLAFVELAHEQQVGELLDDGDWVGDAAGPKSVPNAVYLGL